MAMFLYINQKMLFKFVFFIIFDTIKLSEGEVMKKKYKLKKNARYGLVGIIIIIAVILVGRSIYKDYVYKHSYEYNLELRGYDDKEIQLLIKNLDDKRLDKLANTKKDPVIVAFLQEKYYISKNLDRYLKYYENHKKVAYSDIVALVNTNNDYEHYEHDLKAKTSLDELLLCNKFYKLADGYEPEDLATMKNKYYYGEAQVVRQEVYDAFVDMWNAANEEGIYLIVNSSYRSFEDQKELYDLYKDNYGTTEADLVASRPGYSEHQTGLSVDVFSKDNTSTKTFKDSPAYSWLVNNSYKYGFILRYPEGKEDITGYEFEAWHYRYVGKKVAKELHNSNLTFEEYYAYYIENAAKKTK